MPLYITTLCDAKAVYPNDWIRKLKVIDYTVKVSEETNRKWEVSYRWSIDTNPLSHSVMEISSLMHLGVMTLIVWGSRDVIDQFWISLLLSDSFSLKLG